MAEPKSLMLRIAPGALAILCEHAATGATNAARVQRTVQTLGTLEWHITQLQMDLNHRQRMRRKA